MISNSDNAITKQEFQIVREEESYLEIIWHLKKKLLKRLRVHFVPILGITAQSTVKILAKRMNQLNEPKYPIYAEIVQSKYVKGLHICAA